MYKVLGLAGSPRPRGNTAVLLEQALRGARDKGAEVEKIGLAGLKIGGCLACDGCLKGSCIQKDDMDILYRVLLEADALIIATPIFFYGLPAQAKAAIDRCQLFWNRKYRRHESVRQSGNRGRGSFIAAGATRGEKLFLGAVLTIKYFFEALDIDYVSELLVRGVEAPRAIRQYPKELERAYALGAELVPD